MPLKSDNQTLNDLSILENTYGSKNLFSIFNKTSSDGGKKLLREWLLSPLNNKKEINDRVEAIEYKVISVLEIDREELDFVEYYLNHGDKPTVVSRLDSFVSYIKRIFKTEPDRYIVERGTQILIKIIGYLYVYVNKINGSYPKLYREMAKEAGDIIESTELFSILNSTIKGKKHYKIDFCDYVFRYKRMRMVTELLKIIYQLDVLYTLSAVAEKKSYCFPVISQENKLCLVDFYHPYLKNPVKNSWKMEDCNICIFTGSNMAGKSTTLRTIAICVWLAHCGFPVPATSIECPLFDGIFTSINLPDSLMEGKSHFYAEVIRVKEILQYIKEGKNCFVLFDELFRGTNARDAYDASVSIIDCLKLHNSSFFLISTHIIELAVNYENDKYCCFNYLESEIINDEFICYYKLKDGVSESRVGYWIVKREILDQGL